MNSQILDLKDTDNFVVRDVNPNILLVTTKFTSRYYVLDDEIRLATGGVIRGKLKVMVNQLALGSLV